MIKSADNYNKNTNNDISDKKDNNGDNNDQK